MANDKLVESSLDFAWGQWDALGVRGVVRGGDTPVDLEALIHFTLQLVDVDPRLADEVKDWWSQYGHFISAPRLTALAKVFGTPSGALDTLKNRRLERKEFKSKLDRLDTSPRSLLRLRSAFGGNARADVLLHMLTSTSSAFTALGLTELGISKRTAAEILEGLSLGGLVVQRYLANRLVYSLANKAQLLDVFGPVSAESGRWHLKLPLVARFLSLSRRMAGKDPLVQAVESVKLMNEFDAIVTDRSIHPVPQTTIDTHFARVSDWLADDFLDEPHLMNRAFGGVIEGYWLPPNETSRRAKEQDGALLPRAVSAGQDESLCLDLVRANVVGTKDWIWSVLSTASEDRHFHSREIAKNESWRFVTHDKKVEFEVARDELISPDKIKKHYGAEAAARAHPTLPSIQYRVRAVPAEVGES